MISTPHRTRLRLRMRPSPLMTDPVSPRAPPAATAGDTNGGNINGAISALNKMLPYHHNHPSSLPRRFSGGDSVEITSFPPIHPQYPVEPIPCRDAHNSGWVSHWKHDSRELESRRKIMSTSDYSSAATSRYGGSTRRGSVPSLEIFPPNVASNQSVLARRRGSLPTSASLEIFAANLTNSNRGLSIRKGTTSSTNVLSSSCPSLLPHDATFKPSCPTAESSRVKVAQHRRLRPSTPIPTTIAEANIQRNTPRESPPRFTTHPGKGTTTPNLTTNGGTATQKAQGKNRTKNHILPNGLRLPKSSPNLDLHENQIISPDGTKDNNNNQQQLVIEDIDHVDDGIDLDLDYLDLCNIDSVTDNGKKGLKQIKGPKGSTPPGSRKPQTDGAGRRIPRLTANALNKNDNKLSKYSTAKSRLPLPEADDDVVDEFQFVTSSEAGRILAWLDQVGNNGGRVKEKKADTSSNDVSELVSIKEEL